MADFTQTKPGYGDIYPTGATESVFERFEPLLTPVMLRSRHLFGIPLVSGMKDPRTGKAQIMEDPIIADCIDRACAITEAETGLQIFPTTIEEKAPFDLQEYKSFGYFRLQKRPVASIEALLVTPSNEVDVYQVPIEWVDVANLHTGQINIVPLTIALNKGAGGQTVPSGGPANAVFLALFGHGPWIPAFWRIKYTVGFPNGKLPKIVNELVGVVAAMEVLSMLAPTYGRNNSASLSIDGMSQSVSTPGPELFTIRMDDLQKKRDLLRKKLKSLYGTILFSGNV